MGIVFANVPEFNLLFSLIYSVYFLLFPQQIPSRRNLEQYKIFWHVVCVRKHLRWPTLWSLSNTKYCNAIKKITNNVSRKVRVRPHRFLIFVYSNLLSFFSFRSRIFSTHCRNFSVSNCRFKLWISFLSFRWLDGQRFRGQSTIDIGKPATIDIGADFNAKIIVVTCPYATIRESRLCERRWHFQHTKKTVRRRWAAENSIRNGEFPAQTLFDFNFY